MFRLQKTSQLATVKPDMTVAAYEEKLRAEDLTGGYHPLSGFQATLADCLLERIPNLYFLRYGGIDDLCVGGEVTTPKHHRFRIKTAPRAATGPDLRRTVIGLKGLLGLFTEVTLRVFPIPQQQRWGVAFVDSTHQAVTLLREMLGVHMRPLFFRILSGGEGSGLLQSLNVQSESPVICAFKLGGVKGMVEAERIVIADLCGEMKATSYWPSHSAETEILNATLITPESYHSLLKTCSPLVGRNPSIGPAPGELKFQKYLEESDRC